MHTRHIPWAKTMTTVSKSQVDLNAPKDKQTKMTFKHPLRNPTTSFLTAATLIYTIGAGITAAAGTRLALQLFLVKVFKLFSFQT